MAEHQHWKVVGGEDTGGLLVRNGKDFSSAVAHSRLKTGSIVEELELIDGRLQYILISGSGPATGWVSLKLRVKELLVRVEPSAIEDFSKPAEDAVSKRLNGNRQVATFAMG